jgi:hypothetical protein
MLLRKPAREEGESEKLPDAVVRQGARKLRREKKRRHG